MKFIKKSECTWKNGYIMHDGESVDIPGKVRLQARKLDVMLQEYRYLKAQPKYSPAPSLNGFKAKSLTGIDLPFVGIPATPTTDLMVAQAMAFIDEQKKVDAAADTNSVIKSMKELFEWVGSDEIAVPNTPSCDGRFDTPTLGNMLEVTQDGLVSILKEIANDPIPLEQADWDGDR